MFSYKLIKIIDEIEAIINKDSYLFKAFYIISKFDSGLKQIIGLISEQRDTNQIVNAKRELNEFNLRFIDTIKKEISLFELSNGIMNVETAIKRFNNNTDKKFNLSLILDYLNDFKIVYDSFIKHYKMNCQ